MTRQINAAIVGYGLSGQVFHAPFVHVHPGFHLHTIYTSGIEAGIKYPEASIVRSYDEILKEPEIDLVIICSPNEYHFDQTKAALEAGKNVILEKPVTPSYKMALELARISVAQQKVIFPYQNRRWDGDFLTIRKLISEGELGRVHDFISHFDRFVPEVGRASWRYQGEQAGGTLFDLGVHMIDQAVVLFGKPEAVFCRLFNQRKNSITDDAFDLKLIYKDLNVSLKAGVFVKAPGPRFAIHGTRGSFIKRGLDPQEGNLRSGMLPDNVVIGAEQEGFKGLQTIDLEGKTLEKKVETLAGDYMGFYNDVFLCLTTKKKPEVTIEDAAINIRIIEAAKESDAAMQVVRV